MRCLADMIDFMKGLQLPEPWDHVEFIQDQAKLDQLELVAGPGITYDDLTDDDVQVEGVGRFPKSLRSRWVMGHKWAHLKNVDTDDEAFIRLQRGELDEKYLYASAVVFPFRPGHEVTGAEVRRIPVAAITAAYARRELVGQARLTITLLLGDEVKRDPLEPLGQGSASQEFSAKVARQYMELEKQHPGGNITELMASLNDRPLSTVQQWITRARRLGLVPPASLK